MSPKTTIKQSSLGCGGIVLRLLLCGVLLLALLLGAVIVVNWWQDPVRRLRSFASDIHDFTPPYFNLFGDYERFIRADCSEQDFHRFAREEKFTRRLTEDDPSGVMFRPPCDKSWWMPPDSYRGAYYSFREGGECRFLQYADGRLYYYIVTW